MRESWRLRQIDERVDAQWCLLKQRVWSCDAVSEVSIQQLSINEFLLSSCIFGVHSLLVVLIRLETARCRQPALRWRYVSAFGCGCASIASSTATDMKCSYGQENDQ